MTSFYYDCFIIDVHFFKMQINILCDIPNNIYEIIEIILTLVSMNHHVST
jgi:hypothetical protein